MPQQISVKLGKTLRFIKEYMDQKGVPPTFKEIADGFGISPPSAFLQVLRLEEAGYIKRAPKQWRSIEVIASIDQEHLPVKKMVKIPIVGRVAAGSPILASENVEGYLSVEEDLARKKGQVFALRVKGDSMTGAKINENDCVVVRQQPLADDGDIVIALLQDEGVVKRLRRRGDHIELISENPKYGPIEIKRGDEFRIVGKVIAVYSLPKEQQNG